MEIFFEEMGVTGIISAFKRYFKYVTPELDTVNLVLIDINFRDLSTDSYVDKKGFSIAKRYADDTKNTVVLFGFETERTLRNDGRFMGLMAYPNVDFLRLSPEMAILISKIYDLRAGKKIGNPAVQASFGIAVQKHIIPTLRHDLYHAKENPEKLKLWMARAREIGLIGSEEQIFKTIELWEKREQEIAGPLEGREFPGVFIDLKGTLVQGNGRPREEVIAMAREYAKTRPVTIISDSDPKEVLSTLEELKLNFPFLSKTDLKGTTLEIIVDDMTEEKFISINKIQPRQYICVGDGE